MRIGEFRKAIISAIGTVVTAVIAASADNVIDMDDSQHIVLTLVTAAFGVWAVYRVPNDKRGEE